MSKSVTGLTVEEIPVFKGDVLKPSDLAALYPYLAEPFPAECAEHVSKETSKLGYDVTGIGYQWVVNRLNEVMGPAHWGFTYEELQKETGTWGSNKTNHYSFIKLTILLGNFDLETGGILPVCKPMSHIGGHTASTPHDALAGAISRGIKKTASLYGVGRQTYEHSLDDDLKGDGTQTKGDKSKSITTKGNNIQQDQGNKTGDSIFTGVVAIIDKPKFEQIRNDLTKASVKCKILNENKEATLNAFNELTSEVMSMGTGMQINLNGVSRTDKERYGTEFKLKAGKYTIVEGGQSQSQPSAVTTEKNETPSVTDTNIPPESNQGTQDTKGTQGTGEVFTGQVVLVDEPNQNGQKAWVSVVIVNEEIYAQLNGYGAMKSVIMGMSKGAVLDLTNVNRRTLNNEVQLSLKQNSYRKVS